MRGRLSVVGVVLLLVSVPASAQQEPQPVATDEAERPAIRVLAHPYDIASFYRSDPGAGAPGDVRRDPYAISGFYRSGAAAYRPFAPHWSARARRWDAPGSSVLPEARPSPSQEEQAPPPKPQDQARDRR
jgi:hypothetical protein